ncbi:PPK2 family polyphosphate kinase [Sinimarinibacterium flocculans]|uniref:Polyphosphate:AMP phosphotransferase n=1 Tax=Sinimarinibacterium flocculans TaxID=985250 RepID=A0A318E6S3_9GAMM|nr:PPK2 family polyphosphate kinase [Sinimarinibacterium flocculans]PXV64845.1 polyphosphate:AMP phosphotransferase [Sinimarinibacterium flocculans]
MADDEDRVPDSPHLVPFDGRFDPGGASTRPPPGAPDKSACRELLAKSVERLSDLQRVLYADNRHAVLLIFQAMDAAGKDGTIRAVLTGVDPAGCQVQSFKSPSALELDHDFLWRHLRVLPERGRIGVFNRSWYEEVLAVRVHPGYLDAQRLPRRPADDATLWRERFESINDIERHLARNGTLILKFWLNVSRGEQRERLLARLDEPEKNWKFDAGDLDTRARWDDYMTAYADALSATSKPWAPWYAIPADSKSYMRHAVADIIVRAIDGLSLQYPDPPADVLQRLHEHRATLERDAQG